MTEKALPAACDGMMLGVAQFFANPDNLGAEYAMGVPS
jgi:hypothetical protein